MRTLYTLLLVFGGLVGFESQAHADVCNTGGNLVANCAFGSGDFTGWTISGNTSNPGGNYYGVDGFDAYPGSTYGAYMSQDSIVSENPVDLGQTLATSVGTTYEITFYLDQDLPPTGTYTHSFDATWGGTTLLDLTPTVSSPGPNGVWTEYQYTETASTSSTALTFAFVDDDSYWSFDDVSVVAEASGVPEPSAGLLLLTACAGCVLAARRSPLIMGRKQ
jgi:hypothetical protein